MHSFRRRELGAKEPLFGVGTRGAVVWNTQCRRFAVVASGIYPEGSTHLGTRLNGLQRITYPSSRLIRCPLIRRPRWVSRVRRAGSDARKSGLGTLAPSALGPRTLAEDTRFGIEELVSKVSTCWSHLGVGGTCKALVSERTSGQIWPERMALVSMWALSVLSCGNCKRVLLFCVYVFFFCEENLDGG